MKMKGLLLLLLALRCSGHRNDAKSNKAQMKMLLSSDTLSYKHFKPGVAAEALPDSIYYNKYIPLLVELRVPEWSKSSLSLNSSIHCSSDIPVGNSYGAFGYFNAGNHPWCPVAYHLDKLLAPLADNMHFSKNILTPTQGWSFFGDSISCDLIENHFFHLSAHVDELKLYGEKLKKGCPLAANVSQSVKTIALYAQNHVSFASARFNGMMANLHGNKDKGSKFRSLYLQNKLKAKNQTAGAEGGEDHGSSEGMTKMVQMAGFIGLQTLFIMTKYIETVRWNNAFSLCQNSKLSINLVNSRWLQIELQKIRKIAEGAGYKLSIPFHENLPHYYKLPLTDCIMGMEPTGKRSNLLLRILVPIQKESKYTRFRLTKVPYLVVDEGQKKICELSNFDPKDDFMLELITDPTAPPVILPGSSTESLHTRYIVTYAPPDCFEGELCHVSEISKAPVVDPCLKGLLQGSMDVIRDYCSFECYIVEKEHEAYVFPIIIKLASNMYSITGAHPSSSEDVGKQVNVFCDGTLFRTLEPSKDNGVLQVILPCNCELRHKSDIYRSSQPCDEPYQTHFLSSTPLKVMPNLIPPSTSGNNLSLDAAQIASLLKDAANNVHVVVPATTSTTSPSPIPADISGDIEDTARLTVGSSSSSSSEPVDPDEDADTPYWSSSTPVPSTQLSTNQLSNCHCPSHSGQLGFIWFFLILLFALNAYVLHVLFKNRLLQCHSAREGFLRFAARWRFTSRVPRSRLEEEMAAAGNYGMTHQTPSSTNTNNTDATPTTTPGNNGASNTNNNDNGFSMFSSIGNPQNGQSPRQNQNGNGNNANWLPL